MCFAPQRRALFSTSQLIRKWSDADLYILTPKCPSHHNGVHFFDISTSKSGPDLGVFCTFWLGNKLCATTACTFSTSQPPKVVRSWCVLYIFDLEMCFAPQRRALFRHLNCQKWSGPGVFCTFSLRNVLRATTACNFFISRLASWLRTRRFSEPTFWPSGATNHWKKQCFATCLPFRRICIFFLLTLSLPLFFLLIFLFYSSFFEVKMYKTHQVRTTFGSCDVEKV